VAAWILDSLDNDRLADLRRALLDKNAADLTEIECVKALSNLISQLLDQWSSCNSVQNWEALGAVYPSGPYLVVLIQHFIRAEQPGDWKLHLWCVMIYSFYCQKNNRPTYRNSTTLNANEM